MRIKKAHPVIKHERAGNQLLAPNLCEICSMKHLNWKQAKDVPLHVICFSQQLKTKLFRSPRKTTFMASMEFHHNTARASQLTQKERMRQPTTTVFNCSLMASTFQGNKEDNLYEIKVKKGGS